MVDSVRVGIEALEARVQGILEICGVAPMPAGAVARVIVAGERDGCASHGLHRLEQCLQVLKAGQVEPEAEPRLAAGEGPILRVDAGGGFAPAAWELARPALIARTRELGLAALAITDCLHFAALWPEVEDLARAGLASISMCPSYATVAPFGGTEPLLGTNPFAFGWPRPDADPYVFDFATSVAARGEVELHRKAGTELPEGWAVDRAGAPTRDPQAALDGALLTFGAHKGTAISAMIELLAGAMLGDRMSVEARDFAGGAALPPRHGALILAFDPGTFAAGSGRDPGQEGERLIEALGGQTGRLPSQRRYAARTISKADGIGLSADQMATLDRLSEGGLDAVRAPG